ncbi:hemolysin family protein [Lapillicoccus jejuensis]|uniref:CBS domain containing-hemolysin-like protein n=1 Tax=Lapillicoccus jejuensis TaxID=402171 RepID=A0A542E3G4_9MICO|nr:hemolysin family protein [Lapillicoccus jejuensis]TQJ09881.1 CBS domain containing-hemolysin-like protein [Lapillicoccus jejuensis]
MSALLTLLLGLLVVVLITVATGWFVAQEFAFMTVDRSRLAAQAAAGDRAAERALQVTKRTSFMLSGAQLGITVTGLLVGYVAEPLIGASLGTLLGGVGVPQAVGITVGTVLALLVSTVVQMLFGELVPKNLAIARPDPVARALARSTSLYLTLAGWLVTVFDASSEALLRLLRIEPVHDVEQAVSARDLEHIVRASQESGDLPADLGVLLDRVIDFPTRDVEHAVVPRHRVDVLPPTATLAEVRTQMATGHSRYPVVDEGQQVVGVVHLHDVLAAREGATAADLMRPATVVAGLMTLPDALGELVSRREQLACVVDEYGGFDGILTLEDLAEELVGEVPDEHDLAAGAEPSVAVPVEGEWLVAGDTPLDEVERGLGRDLPRGDWETVSGLVIARHGRLPEPGDAVELELEPDGEELLEDGRGPVVRLEVVDVASHVPATVRVSWAEPTAAAAVVTTPDGAATAGGER